MQSKVNDTRVSTKMNRQAPLFACTVPILPFGVELGLGDPWPSELDPDPKTVPLARTSTALTPGKTSKESSIAHTVGAEAVPAGSWERDERQLGT